MEQGPSSEQATQLVKKFLSPIMETESSLSGSQEPAIGPYTKPSLHLHMKFL
jgi:hypothetical protein